MRMMSTVAILLAACGLRFANRSRPRRRKSTCEPRRGTTPSRVSGDTMTSRSSKSTVKARTASRTKPTTSSPKPRRRISTIASGRSMAPETLEGPARRTDRSASAGIESRSRCRPKSRESRSSSRRPSTTTARSGSTAGCRALRATDGEAIVAGLQRTQPRRAQGPQARQGLSDRGLRDQRTDLGGAVELDLPRRHILETSDKK